VDRAVVKLLPGHRRSCGLLEGAGMEIYEGVVKDRVVVLPEDVHLDEGIRVEVRVRPIGEESLEDLYKQTLVQAGLIKEAKRHPRDVPKEDRTPIRVDGKCLSQMIIEERR
jgi:hypothetical protein